MVPLEAASMMGNQLVWESPLRLYHRTGERRAQARTAAILRPAYQLKYRLGDVGWSGMLAELVYGALGVHDAASGY